MRLHEVMTKNVFNIDLYATPQEAWELMRHRKVHHLVVTSRNKIVGIISERDLGGANGDSIRISRTLSELMSSGIITAKPSTTVREAANLMRGNTIGCLPVLDDDKLVGIVTVTDLLELLGKGIQRIVPETERPILTERDMARARKPRYDNAGKHAGRR